MREGETEVGGGMSSHCLDGALKQKRATSDKARDKPFL